MNPVSRETDHQGYLAHLPQIRLRQDGAQRKKESHGRSM